uniref:Uncharacterized protein n=1 Tax=Sorghum bicolor TaxID=4558 RepID=C6JRM0_SORBI
MEVQSPLKNDGGRKKVIEDEKERGASRHLNLQEVDGQHSYPRKRKSKVASTATLTPGLDLPPGAMLALVPPPPGTMNVLSLNCRGCGRPEAVQEIHQLVVEKKPAVVFLMETRMGEEKALGLARRLGFQNAIVVKSEGLSGGLMLMWHGNVMVAELTKSRSHIDVILSCDHLKISHWRLTGFYGEPRWERRRESWYLLRFLRAQSSDPWLCLGDFNEVLAMEEQMGANEREMWQVTAFQDVVNDCALTDLGFHGLPYTWDNRQEGGRNVKVRLDRALGDNKFMELLGGSEVFHLPTTESDHAGLLVEVRHQEPGAQTRRRRHKPFRYENMWKTRGDYHEFVNRTWDPGPGSANLSTVANALSALQGSFKSWDRDIFGSVTKKVKELRAKLEEERRHTLYRGPTDRERSIMAQLTEVLAREEVMAKQRSRITWLREGDRKTEFFQAKAKPRSKTNRIKLLMDVDGHVFTDQEDLERLTGDFYQRLFSAQDELLPDLVCKHVPRKVTPVMCELLGAPFSEQEVEEALFCMAPNKAPGVDGFNAGFFQTHWDLIKGAILHGRDVLARGLIKRVGPRNISIWEDNWIPGVRPLKPLVRMPRTTVERVRDLFISGTRVWNEAVVFGSFMVLEVAEVLKIKPSTLIEEDLAPVMRPAPAKAKWEKPSPGWFKINTDAGFDRESNSGSAGVVIRNEAGLVAGGSARWIENVPDTLTAEAMAAREGLELVVELGLDRVILEVDCQELSKLLLSQNSISSCIEGLCFDIIELGKMFSEFCIRWVRRDANSVANFCASIVSPTDRCHFWFDNVPGWLVVLADAHCNLAMNQ